MREYCNRRFILILILLLFFMCYTWSLQIESCTPSAPKVQEEPQFHDVIGFHDGPWKSDSRESFFLIGTNPDGTTYEQEGHYWIRYSNR